MLTGLPKQFSKISNPSFFLPSTNPILPCTSARNLGFIIYSFLSFVEQISKLSSTCHYHMRDLRHIRHTLDLNTASTIATSLVHSCLDYCNSLLFPSIFLAPSSPIHSKCASTSYFSYPSSCSHH